MKRFAISAVLLLTVAVACINDRDTLAFEIRNVDALRQITLETNHRKRATAVQNLALRAIAGRFERYPERYYQMRIDRLEAKPSLSAVEYDDLAVAYDRIGNVRQAIKLILESKSKRVTKDDQYRFHANYGTFLVHRWIVDGHKESDNATLKESIAQIEKALQINPNSHFGRERVQLELQKNWLTTPYAKLNSWNSLKPEDVVVGLSGIAIMGLGYELPDVYWLMGRQYIPGQAEESLFPRFALFREAELRKEGKSGVLPTEVEDLRPTKEETKDYARLREDGEKVHQARLAYMNTRFDKGEHPDTHSGFWSEWREPAFPVLKRIGGPEDEASNVIWKIVALGVAGLVAGIYVVWRIRGGVKQRKALLN